MAQSPDRRHRAIPREMPKASELSHQRRRAARVDREQPAAADARARARPHDLQPARELHGASHRRFPGLEHVGRDLQRAVLPGEPALSGSLHPGGDAAAKSRRGSGDVHSGTREVRRGVRQCGDQPQSRPVRRALDLAAAVRSPLVPDLREDGRVRHPGDDPRQHELQPVLPHDRCALPERRHHGLHAVPHVRSVQGLSDAALRHPARRRRGAVSLGPLPRAWRRR